jgi:hypothetical protein
MVVFQWDFNRIIYIYSESNYHTIMAKTVPRKEGKNNLDHCCYKCTLCFSTTGPLWLCLIYMIFNQHLTSVINKLSVNQLICPVSYHRLVMS